MRHRVPPRTALRVLPCLLLLLLLGPATARADLVISTAPTNAVAAGPPNFCTFTAIQPSAVLNVDAVSACLTTYGAATVRVGIITGGDIKIQAPIAGTATSALTLDAADGAVTQDVAAQATVTTGTLKISTNRGVSLDQLKNPVSSVTVANGSDGAVGFASSLPLTVGGITQNSVDQVTVSSDGDLTLAGAISQPSAHLVSLRAAGAVTQTAGTITTGELDLSSGTGATLGAANEIRAVRLGTAGTGALSLVDAQPLTVLSLLQHDGPATITTTSGGVYVGGIADTGGDALSIDAQGAITEEGTARITAGSLTATAAGGIALTSTQNVVASFDATNAGGGAVALTGATAFSAGVSQTGGGDVQLTALAGSLTVARPVAAAGGTVTLAAPGGGIAQSPGATITAAGVQSRSQSGTDLTGATNQIGAFSATDAGSGSVALLNGQSLTVTGISQSGGSVALTTTSGGIVLSGSIAAPGAQVALTAPGGIRGQGGAASIAAPAVLLTSTAATARGWTILPGTVGDGSGAPIALSGVTTLSVMGGATGDTFALTPSASTDYALDGGSASRGVLRLDAQGGAVTGSATPPSGTLTDAQGRTVRFSRMAAVQILNGAPAPAPAPPDTPAVPPAPASPPSGPDPSTQTVLPGRTPADVPTETFRPEPVAAGHEPPPTAGTTRAITSAGRVSVTLPGRGRASLASDFRDLPRGTRIDACHGTVLLFAGRGPGERRAGAFGGGRLIVVSTTARRLTLRLDGRCARPTTLTADADGPFVLQAQGVRTAPVRQARWKLTEHAGRTRVAVVRGAIQAVIGGRTTVIRAGRSRTT